MPRRRQVTAAMRAALPAAVQAPALDLGLTAAAAAQRIAAEPAEFKPVAMTPALAKELEAQGYHLPESWPANARVILDANTRNGWRLEQHGSLNPDHPHFCGNAAYFPEPVLVAPDGTQFIRASNGARVVLVTLSKRLSAKFLRVAPGARRPRWVIESMPKGEIPEHLRKYLLRKGEKLVKGEQRLAREAEAFAVEPPLPESGKITDEQLRAFVAAEAKAGDLRITRLTAALRERGLSVSGGRVREMVKAVAQ